MNRIKFLVLLSVVAVSSAFVSGCNSASSVDPEVLSKLRKAFVLEEEPDGIIQVTEARDLLLEVPVQNVPSEEDAEITQVSESGAEEAESPEITLPTHSKSVVLVGQIGGLTNPWAGTQPDYPFAKNKAKFFLADAGEVAEAEASGHVHAPGEECAFCAAHAKEKAEMIAVVEFHDENGKVALVDVRDLFDLKERETVVVQGEAQVIEGGILVVKATGLYVRR